MLDFDRSRPRNLLLCLLAPEDLARVGPQLEPVELRKGDVLYEPGRPVEQVIFIERGLGSIIATSPEGQSIESGLFGHDGVSAPGLAAGIDQYPHRCIVQVTGEGHRLPASALSTVMRDVPAFRDLLLRYAHVMALQTSYTALSNAVHPVDERLARWLLMCHDRVVGDELALTHEFLSIMLAVRRPSVTTALHVLEGNRFIRAERGVITIRDRRALEEFAGDAYGVPEAEYERLIGPLR